MIFPVKSPVIVYSGLSIATVDCCGKSPLNYEKNAHLVKLCHACGACQILSAGFGSLTLSTQQYLAINTPSSEFLLYSLVMFGA